MILYRRAGGARTAYCSRLWRHCSAFHTPRRHSGRCRAGRRIAGRAGVAGGALLPARERLQRCATAPDPGPPAPPARGERSVIMAWPSETLGALLRSFPHPPGQCILAHTHLASFQGLATTNATSTIGDTLRQPHRKPRYRGTCILCHIFNNQFCYHSIMQNVVRRRLSATIFMRQRAYIQL